MISGLVVKQSKDNWKLITSVRKDLSLTIPEKQSKDNWKILISGRGLQRICLHRSNQKIIESKEIRGLNPARGSLVKQSKDNWKDVFFIDSYSKTIYCVGSNQKIIESVIFGKQPKMDNMFTLKQSKDNWKVRRAYNTIRGGDQKEAIKR